MGMKVLVFEEQRIVLKGVCQTHGVKLYLDYSLLIKVERERKRGREEERKREGWGVG